MAGGATEPAAVAPVDSAREPEPERAAADAPAAEAPAAAEAPGAAERADEAEAPSDAKAEEGGAVSINEVLLAPPSNLTLVPSEVKATVEDGHPNPDGSINIVLEASAPALYVTLTTLAHGRFSRNAIHVPPAGRFRMHLRVKAGLCTYIHDGHV